MDTKEKIAEIIKKTFVYMGVESDFFTNSLTDKILALPDVYTLDDVEKLVRLIKRAVFMLGNAPSNTLGGKFCKDAEARLKELKK